MSNVKYPIKSQTPMSNAKCQIKSQIPMTNEVYFSNSMFWQGICNIILIELDMQIYIQM